MLASHARIDNFGLPLETERNLCGESCAKQLGLLHSEWYGKSLQSPVSAMCLPADAWCAPEEVALSGLECTAVGGSRHEAAIVSTQLNAIHVAHREDLMLSRSTQHRGIELHVPNTNFAK